MVMFGSSLFASPLDASLIREFTTIIVPQCLRGSRASEWVVMFSQVNAAFRRQREGSCFLNTQQANIREWSCFCQCSRGSQTSERLIMFSQF